MEKLLKVCGLWKQEREDKTFLSGKLSSGVKVFVFSNKYKRRDTDPDYHIFLGQAEIKPKGDSDTERQDIAQDIPCLSRSFT